VDEITDAVRNARRVIDRPPSMRYAGPCDHCGTDLLAKPDAATAVCRECGAAYDVADRQMWMRAALEDHLGNASYVAAIATALGCRVQPGTVRMWANRKKLTPRYMATDPERRRPMYRVGDVIETAAKTAQRAPRRPVQATG